MWDGDVSEGTKGNAQDGGGKYRAQMRGMGRYRADGTCDHVFVGRVLGILLGCGGGLFRRHF